MIKAIVLIMLLLLSSAFSIAYHAPSSWLLKQAELPKALKINNITGKLWYGQADAISWQQWQVTNASWDIQLWPLLSKNLQGTVNGVFLGGNFKSDIDANNTIFTAENAIYHNSLAAILKQLALPLVSLTGELDVKLKHLRSNLKSKKIEQLSLKTVWKNATIVSPLALKLGQVTAKSKVIDEKIVTEVQGLSGDIDISGTITINQNQNFSSQLKLHPTIQLSDDIKLTLRLIAKELPNGDYLINRRGNLRYLF